MNERFLRLIQASAKRASSSIGRDSWIVRTARPLYERSLGLLAQGNGVPWQINSETYRVDPRFRHLLGENYEPAVARFLREHLRSGDVVFDVGANVGVYALQIGRWLSGSGKVVAFEPNAAARAVLETHVRMNGLEDRVVTVAAAVADAPGDKVLWASGEDGMARLEEPQLLADTVSSRPVTVTTLDIFAERSGFEPSWILMDIEGYEMRALRGAQRLIERFRGRLGFVIEMHPRIWNAIGTPRDQVEALLSELGLKLEALSGQKDPLDDYGHVVLW